MSMSLRNELRQPFTNLTLFNQSYNWQDWYKYSKEGAEAIHNANPNVLVFLGGMESSTTLTPVVQGTALTPGSGTFSRGDFAGYDSKLVLELHNYANILGDPAQNNCTRLQNDLFEDGFQAMTDSAKNKFPVVMSEFGFPQDATTWQSTFAKCLETYIPAQGAGWMIWVIAGSYYIREGRQDSDESWGLLNHDWSDWRSPEHINGGLIPMVKASLGGQSTGGNSSGTNGNDAVSIYTRGVVLTVALTGFVLCLPLVML
jgi:hypothetical protein